MPHVVIAGAGAMGCLFGGLLAEGGADVTLLARRAAHVNAIRADGLMMLGEGGDRAIAVGATIDAASISHADIVIFLCKAHDTPTVALAVAHLFAGGSGTVAISFQNGLGNEAIIAEHIGSDAVLGGLTAQAATLVGPGVVRNYATLPSLIGEMGGGASPRAEGVTALLNRHGLAVEVSADIVRDKWRKLLLNVALSATSGATNLSIGAVMAVPELEATARRAMTETIAVASACGVDLNDSNCFEVFDAIVGSNAATNTTSMCRDMLARRPSEVDVIYGRTIRLAEQNGVPVPTLRTLAAIVRGVESHYVQARRDGIASAL